MHLTFNRKCALNKTYLTHKRRGKHYCMNGDRESAKCTYNEKELYEERIFSIFSNDW